MTVQYSTGLANALLDGSGTGFDAFNSGSIKLYTGSAPATADAAVTGTLIDTIALAASAFSAAATKARALASTPRSANAGASGTVAYFRVVTSADDGTSSTTQKRIQGTVGTSGADMIVDNTSVNSGQNVSVNSASFGIT